AVVCRDGARMQQLARALEFFAPDLPVMQFPAWDCQPYDRVSPHGAILAQRLTTLARLARLQGADKPLIVLTTVNAAVQRVSARAMSPNSARWGATIRSTRRSARAAAIPAWSIGCRYSRSGWILCSIISAMRRSRSSRRARTPRASVSNRYPIITRQGARRW